MGRGQAQIYLPVGDSTSADWNRPNTFYELTHYGLGPNRSPVNLIDALAAINLEDRNEFPGITPSRPIDLLFVKISSTLIYVRKTDGGEALIKISGDENNPFYQYVPVSGFSQEKNGDLKYKENVGPRSFRLPERR